MIFPWKHTQFFESRKIQNNILCSFYFNIQIACSRVRSFTIIFIFQLDKQTTTHLTLPIDVEGGRGVERKLLFTLAVGRVPDDCGAVDARAQDILAILVPFQRENWAWKITYVIEEIMNKKVTSS